MAKTLFVFLLLWFSGEHICRFIHFKRLTGDLIGRWTSVRLTRI